MPRKTGEDQLLLLTVPWLQQRKHESNSAVPGWPDTHCSRARAKEAAREADQRVKLDVAEMSTPVVDGSPSRAANFVANAPMAAPRQDAMPQTRFRLIERLHDEWAERQFVTQHTERVRMQHETDHTANNVATCRIPSKRWSSVFMRGSEKAKCFFEAGNKLLSEEVSMWANVQKDERAQRTAQVLHFFYKQRLRLRGPLYC